jgi:hypothetical protein
MAASPVLDRLARGPSARSAVSSRRDLGARGTGRRTPPLAGVAACLALAALSAMVLPTVPSYDPWSWIVWGREIVDPHLAFAVDGGPSWKPLPVIFTTVYALLGAAAPTLWVITARAGGLLGLLAAYRLARRLVGGGGWGAIAGLIAVAGVVLTQDWGYYMFRGTSEPLLIATWLWAIDRGLDGRHRSAFVLALATGLMRPESWPLIGLYALWLWVREPRLRPLVVVGPASLPFFWFVPPWIASGHPFLAATHARLYNGHLGGHPLRTVLARGLNLQVAPALAAATVAVALAAWSVGRAGPAVAAGARLGRWRAVAAGRRLTLSLAALIVFWWAVVVGMTLDGYPGLERFFLPAAALTCVLAGVGIVEAALALGRRRSWMAALLTVAALGASVPFVTLRASVLRAQEPIAARAVTRLDELSAAVAAVGGHRGVYPCRVSFSAVNHSVQSALAWKLGVTLGRVGTTMRHQGVMFVGPHDSIDGAPPPVDPRLADRRLIARVGAWRVYRMTTPGADTRCVGGY